MFEENFYAHKYENYPSDKLGFAFVFAAEFISDNYADYRKHECCCADYRDSRPDIYIEECESYSDGERINARCDCKNKQLFYVKLVFLLLVGLIPF